MCTVTFIPLKKGNILTSNRDENISRGIALYPEFYQLNDKKLAFPKDIKAGGTWFISNEFGDAGVLLNGAFEKHIPMPPYRKSRGLVLPEIFQTNSPFEALKKYNLAGIENFTIILWEQEQLKEVKCDGKKLFIKDHNPQDAHIWSSVTLYSENMIAERHRWFNEWVQLHTDITQPDILNFHSSTHTTNQEYGLRISRTNQIATSSITSLCLENKEAVFYHHDLIQNIESSLRYSLRNVQLTNSSTITYNDIAQKN